MTGDEARQIIGKAHAGELHVVAARLSVRPMDNTDDDWQRLEAACLLLGEHAPPRAVRVLQAHKSLRKE